MSQGAPCWLLWVFYIYLCIFLMKAWSYFFLIISAIDFPLGNLIWLINKTTKPIILKIMLTLNNLIRNTFQRIILQGKMLNLTYCDAKLLNRYCSVNFLLIDIYKQNISLWKPYCILTMLIPCISVNQYLCYNLSYKQINTSHLT